MIYELEKKTFRPGYFLSGGGWDREIYVGHRLADRVLQCL
jgi:hypothetical protein